MTLVEIVTEELPADWRWHPTDQFKTGTTEFYCETAQQLANFGYQVIVYYDGDSHYDNGVVFLHRSRFTGDGHVLACNIIPPRGKKRNVFWTNQFHERAEGKDGFDALVVISEYQRTLFAGQDGGESPPTYVVGHGCYPERYKGGNKIKNLCIYTSSPDRGLPFLEEIWPEVEAETGAELIATYNSRLPEQQVDDLYKSAQFWLHPGEGVELFCISAIKAQAAGCIPVVVPNMALAETVMTGVKTTKGNYKADLIEAIKNPPTLGAVEIPTWEQQTRRLENILISG